MLPNLLDLQVQVNRILASGRRRSRRAVPRSKTGERSVARRVLRLSDSLDERVGSQGAISPSWMPRTTTPRGMRAVAVGRKAFVLGGSERAGHAAAIYHSLFESCKANSVNPLTYRAERVASRRSPGDDSCISRCCCQCTRTLTKARISLARSVFRGGVDPIWHLVVR